MKTFTRLMLMVGVVTSLGVGVYAMPRTVAPTFLYQTGELPLTNSVLKLPFQTGGDTSNVAVGMALLLPDFLSQMLALHNQLEERAVEQYQNVLFPSEKAVRDWIAGKIKYPQDIIDEDFRDRFVLLGTIRTDKTGKLSTDIAITDRQTGKKVAKTIDLDFPTFITFQTEVLGLFNEAGIAINDITRARMKWAEDISRPAFDMVCKRYYSVFRYDARTLSAEFMLKSSKEATLAAPKSYLAAIGLGLDLQTANFEKYLDEARKQYEYALTLNQNGYAAATGLFNLALDKGDDAASRTFAIRRATMQGKDGETTLAELYAARAAAAVSRKEYMKAADWYQKAADAQPKSALTYNLSIARVYAFSGNVAKAEQLFRKAQQTAATPSDKQLVQQAFAEMWADRAATFWERFRAQQSQNDLDSALTNYQKSLNEYFFAKIAAAQTVAYLYSTRLSSDAILNATQALSVEALRKLRTRQERMRFSSDLASALNERAAVLEAKGDMKSCSAAEEYLRRAVDLDPGNFAHTYDIVEVRVNCLKNYDLAEQTINDGFQRCQGDNAKMGLLWKWRGIIATRKEQYSAAIDAFKKGLTLSPDMPQCLAGLGLAYFATKQYTESIAPLEKLVAKDSSEAQIFRALGISCYQAKKYDKAKLYLQKSFALNPNTTDAPLYLARVHSLKKEYAEALKFLELSLQHKLVSIATIETDTSFESMRSTPEYGKITAKYR
jgi:tetratricopeptide (TPR) repeat protein